MNECIEKKKETLIIKIMIICHPTSSEHGGHHGHSHGITRSNNKLAQLANTDDNENNSFVFNDQVILFFHFIFFFFYFVIINVRYRMVPTQIHLKK